MTYREPVIYPTAKQRKKQREWFKKMRAILTPDDLKKGDLLEPKWYEAIISEYEEAVTKDNLKTKKKSDGSMNCIFTIKITEEGPGKGWEGKKYFNEKALGFGKTLYAALGFPKNPAGGYDLSTELFQQTKGSKVRVYIKRGTGDNDKEFNEIADFAPMT